jgi:hypothetical protein
LKHVLDPERGRLAEKQLRRVLVADALQRQRRIPPAFAVEDRYRHHYSHWHYLAP